MKSRKFKRKEYKKPDGAKGTHLTDRNLVPVNPLTAAFEPTDSEPIRQRARMAGVS